MNNYIEENETTPITDEEREILSSNITDMTMSGKATVKYETIQFSLGVDVHPDIGPEKTYKYLKQQVYYRMQMLKSDLAKGVYNK
jgi:hypothetical protein